MGLVFGANTSDRVDFGAAGGNFTDNVSLISIAAWFKFSTFTNQRVIAAKVEANGLGGPRLRLNGTTELQFLIARSVVNASCITTNSSLATATWYYVVATYDPADTQPRIFLGSLTSLATERTYNGAQTIGSGSTNAQTTPFLVGNDGNLNVALQGTIATIGVWNRQLSLAEVQQIQYMPRNWLGSTCYLFSHLGILGTGTQPNWSGDANTGSLTGATLGEHVPLGGLFGWDIEPPTMTGFTPVVITPRGKADYFMVYG